MATTTAEQRRLSLEQRKPHPDIEMVEHSEGKDDEAAGPVVDPAIERRY
jgi:hypothetical protein